MYEIYDNWPTIAKESFETNLDSVDFSDVNQIVFSGMGGSGTLSDIFSSILSRKKIHFHVVKGYVLPKTIDSNTLVIPTSISGNTQETLSILNSAKKLNCKIIGFSSGGKLEAFCLKNNIEYRNIPKIHSSRASLVCYMYSILKVLENIMPINKQEINESITQLNNVSKQICSSELTDTNPSIKLASWLSGIPLIYYPSGLKAAAIRFKNSLQENSKTHVIVEEILESCHNGIVAWQKPSSFQPILIKGVDDHPKTKERWEILTDFFSTKNIDFREVSTVSGGILSKLISIIYFLDYTSIYKAILSGIDPTPVPEIEFIKNKL